MSIIFFPNFRLENLTKKFFFCKKVLQKYIPSNKLLIIKGKKETPMAATPLQHLVRQALSSSLVNY